MLSEHRSRERRRLRKSQSATVVLRRGAEASQESSNALAGHVGARTAATVAYGNARVTMPVDAMQSLESRSRNATHRPTSEGSHFARNRSKERNTHRGYTHRDSRQSRPQVRVSRSLQSLAHRASFKTLNLCGGDHTRTEQKSPGVTEVPHAADLYAQGPRQIRPRTKNPNPPTRSSDIKTSAERLEAARDAELLQHHHHHGLRHLRSFAVLTRRSCRSPTNLHPDTAGLCNFVDGTTAPAPIKRSLRRSSLHSSLRQIPSSLRKLYQRTFKADPTLAESTHARSPKSNDIRDDLSQSDQPRAPNARARNTVVATDDESSSPLADMSRAPTPPPHVDLSSLRPGMRQLSQQKHGLLRERSNATRWSDSDSERTILLRRTLHPSQQYTVYGPCESYNEKSHLNGAGHGPQAIPRRASSKIFHGQPAFDTQRKISLFLKHIGEASVSEECTFEPGPTRRYSLAHIDGAHSGLSSRHVTDARTVRLLPQTNRYDDNVSGESLQQGVDDKPLMSPSIYSNDTVTAQAFSSAERYRKQYHRPPSLGTATVGDSCAVTRWSLKTERRASEDTLPNTSSEWRSWASERVAGLSRDTPIDNLNLEGQNDGQRNLTNISSDSNLPKLNYIVTPVKRVKPTGKTSALATCYTCADRHYFSFFECFVHTVRSSLGGNPPRPD